MHSLRTALIASWRSASGTTAATREGGRRCRRSRSRSWSQWSRRNSNGGVGGRKHRLNHPVPYRTSPGGPRHCTLFVSGSVVGGGGRIPFAGHSASKPTHTTPSPSVSLPYSGWPVLQGLRNLWIQRFMLLPAACCTQSLNPYIL